MSVEETLTKLTDAWNAQDVDAIVALFTDDGAFHEPTGPDSLGTTHSGHAAIRAALEASFAKFPDGRIVPTAPVVINGSNAHSEWDFEFSGANGKTLKVHGVDVFTFDGDLIKHKNAFLKQFVAAA